MPFVKNHVLVTEIECWKERILNRGASGFDELVNCICVHVSEITSGRGKADLRICVANSHIKLLSFCLTLRMLNMIL